MKKGFFGSITTSAAFFHPFVLADAKQHKRDYAYEFRLRSVMKSELPIEQELERQ